MCLFMLADSEEGWIFQKVESTKKVQGFFLALLQIEKKGSVLGNGLLLSCDPLNVLQNTFL